MSRHGVIRLMLVVFIAAAVCIGFRVPQAFAQRGACAEDVAKFCKDVQPGQGRILKCMKEHENELSAGCKEHVAQMKQHRQEFREACDDDIVRLCGNVKYGGGMMLKCLKQNENELTPQCKAKLQEMHQKRGQ